MSPADQDGDTLTVCQNDCDDADPTVFPGAPEICDGKDNDCDGASDEGLGQTTCGLGVCPRTVDNCVNGLPQTCVPGEPAAEVCDGLDNDCDGAADDGFDADTDGWVDCLDNCVSVANPDQANADGDPCGDACDQRPLDPDVQTAEVGNSLRLDGHEVAVLTWSAGANPGPFAVYRGLRIPEVDWQYNHARLGAPYTDPTATDVSIPLSGETLYYRVSRLGPCRESVLGRDSAGNPLLAPAYLPGATPAAGGDDPAAAAANCPSLEDPEPYRGSAGLTASFAP